MKITKEEREVLMQLALGRTIKDVSQGSNRGYHTVIKVLEVVKLKNNYETTHQMMYEFGVHSANQAI